MWTKPSLGTLLLIPTISTLVSAYIPAQPVNDTSSLNLTDSSTISISWTDPPSVYSGPVSYQLRADVPTGGTTSGALVHFTESTMGPNLTTSTPWIAYISCDVNETTASQEWGESAVLKGRTSLIMIRYLHFGEGQRGSLGGVSRMPPSMDSGADADALSFSTPPARALAC
jgi:hypothetical protein